MKERNKEELKKEKWTCKSEGNSDGEKEQREENLGKHGSVV